MRSFSLIARPVFSSDIENGVSANAPAANLSAAVASVLNNSTAPLGSTAAPRAAKSNVAVKPRNAGKRVITTSATKPAGKPATKAKPVSGDKPVAETFGMRGTYGDRGGASPSFRMHGHKLSPIVTDRIPGSFSDRDRLTLLDLLATTAGKPFKRRDLDAGLGSRLIGHGYLRYVSGDLASRDCVLQLTARGVNYGKPVTAKPAKAKA